MEELVTEIVDAILLYRSIMDNGTLAVGTTVNHKRIRVNELPTDLRGECVCELSAGGSATIENGMSLSVGTSIQLGKVYILDVAFNIQETFSRIHTGPTGNEYFEDGKLITHHILFKVLEGHLVYHEYDYINEYGTVTHFAEYEVEEATAKVMPHTAYVSDGGPGLYVMSEDRSTVKHYDGWYQAEADIETNPAQFH